MVEDPHYDYFNLVEQVFAKSNSLLLGLHSGTVTLRGTWPN